MGILSCGQILNADDRKYAIVSVPEWGGEVRIRSLSTAERGTIDTVLLNSRHELRQRLCQLTICDEVGELIFQPVHIVKLAEKSGEAMERVAEASWKLSGISGRDVEELEKNCDASLADSSPSA